MLAVKPVKFAVVTPDAVEPVGVVPAIGAVANVEIKYWYPEAGTGDAADQEIVADVLVILDDVSAEGTAHADGVHVKVLPEAGFTVLDKVTVEVFAVPAVVPFQVVVLVLLLKSVFAEPLRPI